MLLPQRPVSRGSHLNSLGTPHPFGVFVYLLVFTQKETSSTAHYMKNVILIEHSPPNKTAKAISCLPCCLKQWILTNQQKLNVNEKVPVAEYNTNSLLIVTCCMSHFMMADATTI